MTVVGGPHELYLSVSVDLAIPSEQAARVPEDRIRGVIERLLRSEGLAGAVEMSVAFVDDRAIADLNATYRHVDGPTDVLSFPFATDETEQEFKTAPGQPTYLGDIAISLPRAEAQSSDYGHSLEREICYLVAHGTLHLLGYEHDDEDARARMRVKEEESLHDLPRGALDIAGDDGG